MQDSEEMKSDSSEIVFEFFPCIRVFKDGHVHRFFENELVPPSESPDTKVLSKDIIISPEKDVSVRIYLPNNHDKQKLQILIYFHGGGFCIESAFSSMYHSYLNNLVSEANVIAVSVEYRRAPEHPIPACYEDSWSAIKWVVSSGGNNQEPWLRDYADLSRMFLAGDSAGANITHDMMVRASIESNELAETGVKIVGMVLVHPFFGNGENEKAGKLWTFCCKGEDSGLDDPRLNPAVHPNLLKKHVCEKILICTAEKDFLRQRGWDYYEALKNSGWGGDVEIEDTEGEGHVFHLRNPGSDNAEPLLKRVATFMK